MKIMNVALMIALAAVFAMTGCAFSSDAAKDEQTVREMRDRNKLLSDFAMVEGTYMGTYNDGESVKSIELAIYHVDEKTETNSSREPVFMPVLYARIKTLDIVKLDTVLGARFFPETGELILSNSNRNDANLQSIGANVRGMKITGQMKTYQGALGNMEVDLVSRESRAPADGSGQETEDRLRRQYEAIVGDWVGLVTPETGIPEKILVRFFITTQTVNGRNVPVLLGFYHPFRSNADNLDATLTVTYKAETTPAQLLLSSAIRPSGFFISMDTVLQENGTKIVGVASTHRGYEGRVELTHATAPTRK